MRDYVVFFPTCEMDSLTVTVEHRKDVIPAARVLVNNDRLDGYTEQQRKQYLELLGNHRYHYIRDLAQEDLDGMPVVVPGVGYTLLHNAVLFAAGFLMMGALAAVVHYITV